MARVWVLGSSNVDVTYRVETIPRPGDTVAASECTVGTGGKGANQALAIAYWGGEVHFIGAVGDDRNGELLLAALKKGGVDATHVEVIEGRASGTAVVLVGADGENSIVVHPGANQRVSPEAVRKIEFRPSDVVVAQLEVNLDAVQTLFRVARRWGATTILNPSPVRALGRKILAETSILIANQHEASALGGIEVRDSESAKECALAICRAGPRGVIVTLRDQGALLYGPRECFRVRGLKVKTVDTQGAGDAFLGSFVSRLAAGHSRADALDFANRVAAYSVTQRGSTQKSMPARDASFLRTRNGAIKLARARGEHDALEGTSTRRHRRL